MDPITLAKADQLIWLGRYTERVFTTLDRFFSTYDAMVDGDTTALEEFCDRLDIVVHHRGGTPESFVFDILYDPNDPASVCSSMRAAFGNALQLRPELGTPTTSYIELALMNLKSSKEPTSRLMQHRSVHDNLLAFWGAAEDSLVSGEMRGLLFFGKYLERLELWSRFDVAVDAIDLPLRKLGFYLGYIRHPECLGIAGTLDALMGDLAQRGYDATVLDRLADYRDTIQAVQQQARSVA